MEKLDITRASLPISGIRGVFETNNRWQNRTMRNSGRISDAFVCVLGGACHYAFDDGNSFTVTEGQLLYLAGSSVYDMTVRTPDYTFIYCDFYFASDTPRRSAVFTPERPSETENLFRRLLRVWERDPHTAFCRSMSLLYEIYGLLLAGDDRAYLGSTASRRIEEAGETIRRRFRDPGFSLGSLSRKAGVSEVYFRKLFRARWGMSPSRYLLSVRLEHAKELLKYPFLPLEECARQSGFSSLSYFCRIFRREVGSTPSQYRKRR